MSVEEQSRIVPRLNSGDLRREFLERRAWLEKPPRRARAAFVVYHNQL